MRSTQNFSLNCVYEIDEAGAEDKIILLSRLEVKVREDGGQKERVHCSKERICVEGGEEGGEGDVFLMEVERNLMVDGLLKSGSVGGGLGLENDFAAFRRIMMSSISS